MWVELCTFAERSPRGHLLLHSNSYILKALCGDVVLVPYHSPVWRANHTNGQTRGKGEESPAEISSLTGHTAPVSLHDGMTQARKTFTSKDEPFSRVMSLQDRIMC